MAFLDRYKQTRAQRGLERSDSYVVGRARVPSVPSSPNLLIYLVLGIVAALGASAAAVAILQLLERGIETSDAVEKKLGVMSLGSLPDTASLPEFDRSEEHTSELQSLMRTSYAVFLLTNTIPNPK